MPAATEDEIGWAAVERLSIDAAALLMPAFAAHQRPQRTAVDPDRSAALPQCRGDRRAGAALRSARAEHDRQDSRRRAPASPPSKQATAQGISINATVSFTLPQCVAVAEAVERGLQRREAAGTTSSTMGPVCTIMVGRLDDWLKVVMESDAHQHRPGPSRMGRRGGVQEDLSALSRARLSHAPAVGRVSQPHALERADRRRRRDLAAVGVAEALRRQRHRGPAAHRHAGRSRASSTISTAASPTSAAPTTRTASRRRVRRLPADAADACASSSARVTTSGQLVRDVMLPESRRPCEQ